MRCVFLLLRICARLSSDRSTIEKLAGPIPDVMAIENAHKTVTPDHAKDGLSYQSPGPREQPEYEALRQNAQDLRKEIGLDKPLNRFDLLRTGVKILNLLKGLRKHDEVREPDDPDRARPRRGAVHAPHFV